jgi:hypothetical protein
VRSMSKESEDRQGYCFGSTLASVIDQGGTNCLHTAAANHMTPKLGCLHSANSSTKPNACRPGDLRPHQRRRLPLPRQDCVFHRPGCLTVSGAQLSLGLRVIPRYCTASLDNGTIKPPTTDSESARWLGCLHTAQLCAEAERGLGREV